MAIITFYGLHKFSNKLVNISNKTSEIGKKAVEAVAKKMKPIMLQNLRTTVMTFILLSRAYQNRHTPKSSLRTSIHRRRQ
jgi:hypothetical protein